MNDYVLLLSEVYFFVFLTPFAGKNLHENS